MKESLAKKEAPKKRAEYQKLRQHEEARKMRLIPNVILPNVPKINGFSFPLSREIDSETD
jgi:hypothetical protein